MIRDEHGHWGAFTTEVCRRCGKHFGLITFRVPEMETIVDTLCGMSFLDGAVCDCCLGDCPECSG